jgi:hypothetical protein
LIDKKIDGNRIKRWQGRREGKITHPMKNGAPARWLDLLFTANGNVLKMGAVNRDIGKNLKSFVIIQAIHLNFGLIFCNQVRELSLKRN